MVDVLAKGTPWGIFLLPVLVILLQWPWYAAGFPLVWYPVVELAVLGSMTFLVFHFFRDPERSTGEGLVAPAHGRVLGVEHEGGRTRVSTFMSPLDVHVIRAPLAGKVVLMERHGSGFLRAYDPEAGHNVQLEIGFEGVDTTFTVVMITGWLARRIVPYISPGDEVDKGSRIGLIRFGSRVDVMVPRDNFSIHVREGDRVKAGSSSLGVAR